MLFAGMLTLYINTSILCSQLMVPIHQKLRKQLMYKIMRGGEPTRCSTSTIMVWLRGIGEEWRALAPDSSEEAHAAISDTENSDMTACLHTVPILTLSQQLAHICGTVCSTALEEGFNECAVFGLPT